jgi:outer membrane receptor protein involved in Fe transport
LVNAQESDEGGETDLEEVVVTGSRIQREDYVSPNPVSTFDAQRMENLGLVNIADVITQVPQNVSQFQAATTGGSAFFIGSTLANLRGLNPFFGTRTLTLVDSRRFIPTTQGDSVDLNFIPSILIARTEIVTGGASAAYGSGAVSVSSTSCSITQTVSSSTSTMAPRARATTTTTSASRAAAVSQTTAVTS